MATWKAVFIKISTHYFRIGLKKIIATPNLHPSNLAFPVIFASRRMLIRSSLNKLSIITRIRCVFKRGTHLGFNAIRVLKKNVLTFYLHMVLVKCRVSTRKLSTVYSR